MGFAAPVMVRWSRGSWLAEGWMRAGSSRMGLEAVLRKHPANALETVESQQMQVLSRPSWHCRLSAAVGAQQLAGWALTSTWTASTVEARMVVVAILRLQLVMQSIGRLSSGKERRCFPGRSVLLTGIRRVWFQMSSMAASCWACKAGLQPSCSCACLLRLGSTRPQSCLEV